MSNRYERINDTGTTGGQLELEVFGKITDESLTPEKLSTEEVPEYHTRLWSQLKEKLGNRYIILYDKSNHEMDKGLLELLIKNQPGSLSQDVSTLTIKVKNKLIDMMPSLESQGVIDNSFVTTVGTILDKIAGIDGLFVFNHEGKRAIVALDITQRPAKDEHKADLIMKPSNVETEDNRYFSDAELENYAKQIANSLVGQIKAKKVMPSQSMAAQGNGDNRSTGGPRKRVVVDINNTRR